MTGVGREALLERFGLGDYDVEETLDGMARLCGMRIVPAVYDISGAITGSNRSGELRLNLDGAFGPFFVTRLQLNYLPATTVMHVSIRSGTRVLTYGRCNFPALAQYWANANSPEAGQFTYGYAAPMAQPLIVVNRSDELVVQLEGPAAHLFASVTPHVMGFHLRTEDMRKPTDDDRADRVARRFLETIGELVMAGVTVPTSSVGQTYAALTPPIVEPTKWQWCVNNADPTNSVDIRHRIAGIDVFPRGLLSSGQFMPAVRIPNLITRTPPLIEGRFQFAAGVGAAYDNNVTFVGTRQVHLG